MHRLNRQHQGSLFGHGVRLARGTIGTGHDWYGAMHRALTGILVAAVAVPIGWVDVAAAQSMSCAQVAVSARGEPARFEFLARTKARANWRARVRMTPGLGDLFANWQRAMNTQERCISGPDGTVCTMTGTPCRS